MASEGRMSGHTLSDYEEKETSWALQRVETPDNDIFRPSISDQQKIGFFSLDRCTQTEDSDVVELKEMTEVIKQLLEDAAAMKRDINFARHVMQADFEAKLQQKSIELYVRVNDKITDIEKMHEERVSTIRRAFKQQLCDALARMHKYYNRDFASKLQREKTKHGAKAGKWETKYRELQETAQRNEALIKMLKAQVADFQRQAEEAERKVAIMAQLEDNSSMHDAKPPDHHENHEHTEPEVVSTRSRSPGTKQEIEELQDEVETLERKVSKLQAALDIREENTRAQEKDIENLHEQLERERILVEQMRHEQNEMQEAAQAEKASSKRQVEGARLAMQRNMHGELSKIKEEALAEARREAQQLQDVERERVKQLMEEKRLVEQLLAKEKSKTTTKNQDTIDLEKVRRSEQKLVAEVSKLKKEIERVHKTWEKKFAILQQSLHALKDESYLRQTMQRQAAQLHQASISYAYDIPMGVTPSKLPSQPSKKPLPDIGKHGKSSPVADYISYTVSAHSGRATKVFSVDENQVLSDAESDLPSDIVPLPSPPPRNLTECRDDSRPSTHSHIVVLPSVEAN